MEKLLLALDLMGTFVFAFSGAWQESSESSTCSAFWRCRSRRETHTVRILKEVRIIARNPKCRTHSMIFI
jgi:hypothetical protein